MNLEIKKYQILCNKKQNKKYMNCRMKQPRNLLNQKVLHKTN